MGQIAAETVRFPRAARLLAHVARGARRGNSRRGLVPYALDAATRVFGPWRRPQRTSVSTAASLIVILASSAAVSGLIGRSMRSSWPPV